MAFTMSDTWLSFILLVAAKSKSQTWNDTILKQQKFRSRNKINEFKSDISSPAENIAVKTCDHKEF